MRDLRYALRILFQQKVVTVVAVLSLALAGYLPTRRASNVDPLAALRYE